MEEPAGKQMAGLLAELLAHLFLPYGSPPFPHLPQQRTPTLKGHTHALGSPHLIEPELRIAPTCSSARHCASGVGQLGEQQLQQVAPAGARGWAWGGRGKGSKGTPCVIKRVGAGWARQGQQGYPCVIERVGAGWERHGRCSQW